MRRAMYDHVRQFGIEGDWFEKSFILDFDTVALVCAYQII
jgi:hypothetical protein